MTWPSTRDLLRLYRVRDWLHFLPLPLAGWFAAGAGTEALVGGVLGWTLALAYTCAINQAFDDRLDRAHAGKNPVGTRLRRRQAISFAVPPGVAAIVVVAWLAPSGLLPLLVHLLASTLYSAPPRVKRVPLLGTVWNVVIGLPGLFIAATPDLAHGSFRLMVGLFAILLVVAQLIHEAEDREDDQAGGISTIGTLAGMSGALGAGAVCLLVLPAVTWWLAHELRGRVFITLAAGLFSTGWILVFGSHVARGDNRGIRIMRLRYRYAALMLGVITFAVAML